MVYELLHILIFVLGMERANVQDSKRWKAWVGGKVECVTAFSAISCNFYIKSLELPLDLSIKDDTHRKFTVNIYQHCDRIAKIHAHALGSTMHIPLKEYIHKQHAGCMKFEVGLCVPSKNNTLNLYCKRFQCRINQCLYN
jgi:hypothetical protein